MHSYLKLAAAAVLLGPLMVPVSAEENTQVGVESVTTIGEGNLSAPAPPPAPIGKRDPAFNLTDAVDTLQEVARVNDRSILVQDVATPLQRLRLSYVEAPEKVRYLLDQLITNELLAQEAVRLGLDKDPQVQAKTLDAQRKIIAVAMAERLAAQTNKTQLKHYYTQHPDEFRSLKIAQILLKDEAQANDIYKQLADGADFEALARQYSEDKTTRDRGGLLGDMVRGMTARPLENVVYALKPGEVGKPVSTGLGYHVVKLLESAEPVPFGQLTPEQVNGVRTHLYNNNIERLKAAADIVIHSGQLAAASLAPPVTTSTATPSTGSLAATQSQINTMILGRPAAPAAATQAIATVNGTDITSADLADKLGSTNIKLGPYYSTPTGRLELLDQLITRELLYQEGLRIKLEEDPSVRDLLQQPARSILTTAMKDRIEQEQQGEAQLEAFYTEHPHDFRTVKLAHIQVDHERDAQDIYKKLQEGADYAQLVEQYTTDGASRALGGVLAEVNVWSGLERPLQEAALALDVNQVGTPFESQYGWQIFKVVEEKDPPAFDTLNSAQLDAVRSRVFHYELDKLVKDARIEIHQDPVEQLIAAKKEEDRNRNF